MLPLGRALAEPAVVRQVHQEIRIVVGIFAGEVREDILEADQHGGFHVQVGQGEGDRAIAGGEAAFDRREPFHKGQPAHERDILAEDDQVALAVAVGEVAVRGDQEAGVVILVIIRMGGMSGQPNVVGAEDQPCGMLADEVGDGGVDVRVPTGVARHRRLGPDQQVRLVGQGLHGEMD